MQSKAICFDLFCTYQKLFINVMEQQHAEMFLAAADHEKFSCGRFF